MLKDILKGKVVIVGIGNVLKGDDGFGPALIERLNGKMNALCIDAGTAPENYTGKIVKAEPDTILLVDAAHLDLEPGRYRILKPDEILKSGFTTHDMSPRMFMEYIGSRTKAAIYMLGIQPEKISLGDEMSETVKKTLDEIARKKGVDVRDLFFDIVFGVSPIIAKGAKPHIIQSLESREAIKKANHHWLSVPITDMTPQKLGGMAGGYGAYITMPRFFRDAVDSGIRMEEAIRKMTSFPAQSWGLYDRGILRPGMKADIAILDAAEYRPVADLWHPNALAAGVSHVIVNGKLVLDNGELTKERPGEVLSRMQ